MRPPPCLPVAPLTTMRRISLAMAGVRLMEMGLDMKYLTVFNCSHNGNRKKKLPCLGNVYPAMCSLELIISSESLPVELASIDPSKTRPFSQRMHEAPLVVVAGRSNQHGV
jgi:hypothetical protein